MMAGQELQPAESRARLGTLGLDLASRALAQCCQIALVERGSGGKTLALQRAQAPRQGRAQGSRVRRAAECGRQRSDALRGRPQSRDAQPRGLDVHADPRHAV